MPRINIFALVPLAAALAFSAASAQEEVEMTLLVEEAFNGDSATELNGSDAGSFSSAILGKGGAATWGAAPGYKTNGSVNVRNSSAYLNLGSYIDDVIVSETTP